MIFLYFLFLNKNVRVLICMINKISLHACVYPLVTGTPVAILYHVSGCVQSQITQLSMLFAMVQKNS